jgi:hypothetical protein
MLIVINAESCVIVMINTFILNVITLDAIK